MSDADVDGYGIHPYPGTGEVDFSVAGGMFEQEFAKLRQVKIKWNRSAPFWVTETGASTSNGFTEQQQCDVARRLYNRLISMGDVQAVFFHTLRMWPAPPFGPPEPDSDRPWEYGYGWMEESLTPRKVYTFFAARSTGASASCSS